MAYIDRFRSGRSVSDLIREMLRAVGFTNPIRLFTKARDANQQEERSLSVEMMRDIGVCTEYQDYATSKTLACASNRRLFDVADAVRRWPHR